MEAWSDHDYDAARSGLAPDVKVTAITTTPGFPATDLSGAVAYMAGLVAFAQGVVPGSARLLASLGDELNALLTLTVQTSGPDGTPMTLPGSRLYRLDEDGKIKVEQIVFYAAPE